jgi:hypothetical protein
LIVLIIRVASSKPVISLYDGKKRILKFRHAEWLPVFRMVERVLSKADEIGEKLDAGEGYLVFGLYSGSPCAFYFLTVVFLP